MKLTEKAKEEFEKWFFKYYNKDKISVAMFSHEVVFSNLQELAQNAYITEWFDTIGITVDVMPRMADENKIVFEPNTFCLKHEIVTEDFIQFENRQDAIEKAIEKANQIYNSIKL